MKGYKDGSSALKRQREFKTHLINWKIQFQNKKCGGLGLGGLINRNHALLANGCGSFPMSNILFEPLLSGANLGLALMVRTSIVAFSPVTEVPGSYRTNSSLFLPFTKLSSVSGATFLFGMTTERITAVLAHTSLDCLICPSTKIVPFQFSAQ